MFEYFYNEILRRTVISFGTLFNGISIKHTDSAGTVTNVMKVPLAYGPTQKFLARLEQSPDLNKSTAMTLPRMSFEFTGLTYDPSRKVSTTQQIVAKDPNDGSEFKKTYMPVPYNMQFELSIMSKLNDDALQIVEQILPYFQPAFSLSVQLVDEIRERRDIPVILENITMQDDYEGDFSTRRVLLYTLRFTAKTYLFGPVSSASKDIIKKSTLNYLAGTDTSVRSRGISYSATPRAIKDYTGDIVTLIDQELDSTTTTFNVGDGTKIISKKYIDVNGEEMYVKSISGNRISVKRAQDNTTAVAHPKGTEIKGIDYTDVTTSIGTIGEDSAIIPEGDDFGFSGDTF
tara:strand:+ start:12491 stop:13525 length:1035 start_codon:yes stop_codon:yes gene_type:complete